MLKKITNTGLSLLRGFSILSLMLYLGYWISYWFPLGIPSSIWGLLLLFISLNLQWVKVEWVFPATSLIIRYMAILFVPASVGILKYQDLLLSKATALIIPNLLSTFITLILVAFLADYLFSRRSFRRLRQKVKQKRVKDSA